MVELADSIGYHDPELAYGLPASRSEKETAQSILDGGGMQRLWQPQNDNPREAIGRKTERTGKVPVEGDESAPLRTTDLDQVSSDAPQSC